MSNLPPGVTLSMIPGNRPEDEAEEAFWEALHQRLTPEQSVMVEDASDGLIGLIEAVRDLAYEAGRRDERSDTEIVAAMTAAELGITRDAVDKLLGR